MSNQKLLTPGQVKFLRGIAHGLNPVIIIGSKGVTESLMKELETSLEHHELLKIKIAVGEKDDRKAIIDHILVKTKANLIQSIGKTCVIFKAKKDSEIQLPR